MVTRKRSETDERNLIVEITPDGEELKEKAMNIPGMIAECINITAEEGKFLYDILYKITEVFLRPIRAMLLKVEFIRNLRIDFSPIILIAIISLLERVLASILLFL